MASGENYGHFLLPLTMNQGPIDVQLAERLFALRSEHLHKRRPERHAIRNLLAMLAFRLGHFDKALEYLDKILSPLEDPNNLNALANRQYMCQNLFRVQEARECEKRIVWLLTDGDTEEMETRRKKLRARSLAEQAFAYSFELFEECISFGRYRKSIELYQTAIELAGNVIDKEEMDEWIFTIGVASFIIYKRIKYVSMSDEAKTRLQTAINSFIQTVNECQDKNFVSDAWRHLGVLFKQSAEQKQSSLLPSLPDDFQEYVRKPGLCFEKAYSVSPHDPRILARHAEYCKNSGDIEKALELVNESIQLNATVFNLHAYCVRAYILIEQYKEQLTNFRTPSLTLLEDAEKDLAVTLQTFVTPWHLATMAEVFYLKALDRCGNVIKGKEGTNNLQVALTYCAKAAACYGGKKRPEVHKQRGECLCVMGEHQTALGCFKRAVDCEIANQFYKGSIGRLVIEYVHVLRYRSSTLSFDPPFLADMVYWLQKAAGICLSTGWILTQLQNLQQIPGFWKIFIDYCIKTGHGDDLESIELAACAEESRCKVYRQHSYPTLNEESVSESVVRKRCKSFPKVGSVCIDTSPTIQKTHEIRPQLVTAALSSVNLEASGEVQEDIVYLIYNLKTGNIHIPSKLSSDSITKDVSCKHVKPAPDIAFNQQLPNDFFVIYSDRASEWVQHSLLEELERNRLKGCIRHRDFILGKPNLENYSDCIKQSVCIIVVITKDFEKDQGCVRGMLMAMEEGKVVISILRESRDLPQLLKPYAGLDATDGTVDWARLERNIEQQINSNIKYDT
ncbi:tetratricopeptide repeat protein 22-like [Acanthaster planci]|uniref:Tetratricopeptide repeat protein 22-like n=1 Tax=Acanthaster planci TaxID=133434 RepID=A0A8B7XVK8_ACAPL|nr:tetratricopeptide repeat protein 22-like [Acanthaster planci]